MPVFSSVVASHWRRVATLFGLGAVVAGLLFAVLADAATAGGGKERRVWKLRGSETIPSVRGFAVDRDGSIVAASSDSWSGTYDKVQGRQQILRLFPNGDVEVIAGSGRRCSTPTPCGDNELATDADLGSVSKLAVGPNGDVLFLEGGHYAGKSLRVVSAKDKKLRTVPLGDEAGIRIYQSSLRTRLVPVNLTVSGPDVLFSTHHHGLEIWRLIEGAGEWSVEKVAGGGDNEPAPEPSAATDVNLEAEDNPDVKDGFLFSTRDGFGIAGDLHRIVRATRQEDGAFTLRSVANNPTDGDLRYFGPPIEDVDGVLLIPENDDGGFRDFLRLNHEETAFSKLDTLFTRSGLQGEFNEDSSYEDPDSDDEQPLDIEGEFDESDPWYTPHRPRLDPSGTPLSKAHFLGNSVERDGTSLAAFPGGGFLMADRGYLRLIGPEDGDDELVGLVDEGREHSCDNPPSRTTGIINYLNGVCNGKDRYRQFFELHFRNLSNPSQAAVLPDGEGQTSLFRQLPRDVRYLILSWVHNSAHDRRVLPFLAASALDLLE